jgi:RNA polymerase sigma-70 factor (ECF subfamily)
VRGYLLRRADPELASEALSETFLAAWRRLEQLPADDPLPWLIGTARKALANQRRSARRLGALRERAAGAAPPPAGDPAEDAGGSERVREALARLRERDREALMLVAWEGLEPSRAAAAAGCSSGAFAVRLHRARGRLAAALGALDEAAPRSTPDAMETR